jgi:protoporphyrinogen oxidase
VIIGGGLAGLSAAYRLAQNHHVTIIEKEEKPGGMVQSYHIDDYYIEKYYHHFFSGDSELLEMIDELGLTHQVLWLKGTTGYYWHGKAYPMNTPLEILKFPPLSIVDILRLGLLVMRTKTIKDIRSYDSVTAKEWIIKTAGKGVYNNFFLPLLTSKFGRSADKISAAWLMGRVKIRSDRSIQGEKLGYLRTGFYHFIRTIAESVEKKGARIITGNSAESVLIDNDQVVGVKLKMGSVTCDTVISTVAPASLSGLTEPDVLDLDLDSISYQGTCCALMGIPEPLIKDGTYWLNINNADVPFGALIEHTNLLPADDYSKEHLVYIASYFQDKEDILYTSTQEDIKEMFLDGINILFPEFDRNKMLWWKLARDTVTAPVYETGYADRILPYQTNIRGLYLAGMFSEANYPERSMNGSIKAGYNAAYEINRL